MNQTRTFDVTPNIFDEQTFNQVMLPYVVGAEGLALRLRLEPAEHGWDQSNFHDHDVGMELTDAAIAACKAYAKANQLFYNSTKLEDAVTRRLTEAFGEAWFGRTSEPKEGLPD